MALTLVGLTPAQAAEAEPDPLALASEVAPDQGEVVQPTNSAEGITATVDDATIVLPDDASDAVEVSVPGTGEFTIPLPDATSAEAQLAEDGTVVFPATEDDGVTVLVQVLESDSVRIQTVVEEEGPSTFTYQFDDQYVPMTDPQGNVVIADMSNPAEASVLMVDAPWAIDAAGRDVATYYEVDGQSLVQVIVPDAATQFPVVADPRWEWRSAGYGAALNRAETNGFASAQSAAAVCLLAGAWNIFAGAYCGALAGVLWAQASIAKEHRQCVFVQIVPFPQVYRYTGGYCR
jgi:hypothetical protein